MDAGLTSFSIRWVVRRFASHSRRFACTAGWRRLLSTACELADVNKARLRNLTIGLVQMTAPLYLGNVEARCAQTRILENCGALVDQGKLKVSVSSVLPLSDAATAHRMIEAGHTVGKVVLQID